ncbi:Transposase [Oopsacas minuta]|uniref:Transposase n=1 Tax=Oopsacas minuta TaxID=111878 RepID=A0AAV7JEJ0_9METZ|nr:Transposase [Oopsacas minuta]
MENLKKRDFRDIIFYNFKRGLNVADCSCEMFSIFGGQSPTQSNIYKWYRQFRLGHTSLDAESRSGRPITAVTEENIDKVSKLVTEDRQITVTQLAFEVSVSSGTIETILHQHLGLKRVWSKLVPHLINFEQKNRRIEFCRFMLLKYSKRDSRRWSEVITCDEKWIYYYDIQSKQQNSKWIFEDEQPDTIPKQTRVVSKRMFAVFFSTRGIIEYVMLPEEHTVTVTWYTENCLPQVFQAVERLCPKTGLRGMKFHHDNAPVHIARKTKDYIKQSGLELIYHAPYSPDLAPCDFWLFPIIKHHLKGRRFDSETELSAAFFDAIDLIPESRYSRLFDMWLERCQRCIDANGEYYEHLK